MSLLFLLLSFCALSAFVGSFFHKKLRDSRAMLGFIVAACVGFIVYGFVGMNSAKVRDEQTLVVGISADFPPFSYIQENEFVGFDVDLINIIAQRMNKKIVFKNMPFSTLLPSLQLGTIDVIASGLTSTPERAKKVLFTMPYLNDGPLVIISKKDDSFANIEALHDKTVAVNEGYTADQFISKIDGIRVLRLKSPAQAFLSLSSGRANAFVTAENTVKSFFDESHADQFHIATLGGTVENSSLAITPLLPALHEEIQKELDDMKTDGSLTALRTKWQI